MSDSDDTQVELSSPQPESISGHKQEASQSHPLKSSGIVSDSDEKKAHPETMRYISKDAAERIQTSQLLARFNDVHDSNYDLSDPASILEMMVVTNKLVLLRRANTYSLAQPQQWRDKQEQLLLKYVKLFTGLTLHPSSMLDEAMTIATGAHVLNIQHGVDYNPRSIVLGLIHAVIAAKVSCYRTSRSDREREMYLIGLRKLGHFVGHRFIRPVSGSFERLMKSINVVYYPQIQFIPL